MATVHLGRLLGPVGFSRTVAIKRSHPEMAADPDFVSMFLDEARLAARIRHPNVVSTLDVVALEGELFLVMDFVQGESLSRLMRAAKTALSTVPRPIACTIMADVLHGLHAAHEAKNERGEPLSIVHRDVSPQNILVGIDGIARVLDFGVAKAVGRVASTREGQIKGKLSYLAPEQLGGQVSRQSDIYAAAVVLWEALTSERLFHADNPGDLLNQILNREVAPPSVHAKDISPALDAIVLKALAREPSDRFTTAREMALELERCSGQISAVEIGEWVERMAKDAIAMRARKVEELENYSASSGWPAAPDAGQAAAMAAERRGKASQESVKTIAEGRFSDDLASSPTGRSIASVSRYPQTEPRKSRTRFAVLAAVAFALVGAATVARRSRPPIAPAATPATSSSPTPAVTPAVAEPTAAPEPSPEPALEPAASARVAGAPPKGKPHAPAKKKVDCSFPYIIDEQGIQHIKKECLH
jgi:serine/threonine-protein kinase